MAELTPESITDTVRDAIKEDPHAPKLRWGGLLLALIGCAVLVTIAINVAPDNSVRTVAVYYVALPLGLIFTLVWWTFFSGLSWSARRWGLYGFAGLLVAGVGCLRVEGFNGDMFPIFALRWSPTPEETARAYRETVSADGPQTVTTDVTLAVSEGDWPEFRGPRRDGIVPGITLSRDFEKNPPKELWRHPVGLGWGSFAVVGDYCWTMEQQGSDEAVVCYNVSDGTTVWTHKDEARFSETLGGDGPRSTPSFYDGKVYTQGATGILNCLDALSGDVIWTTNILKDAEAQNITWAISASPLIVDDTVVVNAGIDKNNNVRKAVIAYGAEDGKVRWAKGSQPASYAGLREETLRGVRQLILYDGNGVAGLKPEDGAELWRFAWNNGQQVNAAQPIVVNEHLVFVSASYSSGSALLDVTKYGDEWNAEPLWAKKNFFKLKFNDGIYKDGFVYGLDESFMSCIELVSGKRMWKARSNTGYGQLLLIGDLLVIQCESGELAFAEPDPKGYNEIYRQPALAGKTWNIPAYSRGRLLLRNSQEAVCYELTVDAK